jgi:hypothetical protein
MAQSIGGNESAREADRSSPAKTERHLTPPWELKDSSRWARVYIDSSLSMQGFIGDQSGSHFRLLKRLKDILVDAHVLSFEASPFGLKILRMDMVSAFSQFGTDRRAYAEKDTYLAGVIEDASSWNQNGVILILTDGISSVTKSHGLKEVSPKKDSKQARGDRTEPQSARTCSLGSDSACLALRIHEYIQSGHGFWIVGFRFPFDGPYWVEEGGPKARPGVKLERVKVPDRPFYVWVGGADVEQGRKIVRGLIRFAGEGASPVPFMAVEIAPGLWERWDVPSATTLQEIDQPPRQFCPREGGALPKTFHTRGSGKEFPVLEVKARQRGSLGVQLPLWSKGVDTQDITSLLQFRQDLVLDLPQSLTLENKSLNWSLRPYQGVKEGRVRSLDLCVMWDPPQALLGKDMDVVARWKIERATTVGDPWEAWSTDIDDTPETARQTVNLSIFFRHLLDQLMPESRERPFLPTPSETFMRIQFRK